MTAQKSALQKITALIHHSYQAPAGFEAVVPAVHKASTILFKNTAALRARDWKEKTGYTYGLHGTPTTFTLEERIATLEGGLQTVLLPSGLAAITLWPKNRKASGESRKTSRGMANRKPKPPMK